ncbi:MAG: hypothetical protein LBF58_08915 [Deltaproteobacteria bacterium]|jgi:molybdopterin biosynthesis enzyme|nr:hypothetical protein [Deltaproteobacteria bacterium]
MPGTMKAPMGVTGFAVLPGQNQALAQMGQKKVAFFCPGCAFSQNNNFSRPTRLANKESTKENNLNTHFYDNQVTHSTLGLNRRNHRLREPA